MSRYTILGDVQLGVPAECIAMAANARPAFLEAQGRREACALLTRTYEEVRDSESSGSRLISITGRPGVGKTRVVQQFYEGVAAKQLYWPRSLIDYDAPPLSRQRKRIGPRGTVWSSPGFVDT